MVQLVNFCVSESAHFDIDLMEESQSSEQKMILGSEDDASGEF